jgi:hypothetical protein
MVTDSDLFLPAFIISAAGNIVKIQLSKNNSIHPLQE